jgi:hypothetical protein
MENIFLNAGIIAIIYFLFKFAEMRVILKETKPVKDLAKDTLVVYFSVLVGIYVIDQIMPGEISSGGKIVGAFTDAPAF